jgi:scyllo-inositol 2-dehydrogenase (NADP+)
MTLIKTALLSFGMSGKLFHAPFIHCNNNYILVGAWERKQKTIQNFYPQAISYKRLEDILEDTSIDLVIVNTPTITHFDYAKKALLAGKHVVVEKAFTTTVEEAITLKKIAEKVGKKISIYQSRRWDSDFLTTQKIIYEQLVGDLIDVTINFVRFRPALSNKPHKELPQPGAGLLNDIGPHVLDQAICLFGMPIALYATLRNTRQNTKVDDWFYITLYYSTFTVSVHFSYFAKFTMPGYIVNGTNGSFIKNRADVQEAQLLAGIAPVSKYWGIENKTEKGLLLTEKMGANGPKKIESLPGNYGIFYEKLSNSMLYNTPLPVTCDEAINVMQLIELAQKSNQLGAKITV